MYVKVTTKHWPSIISTSTIKVRRYVVITFARKVFHMWSSFRSTVVVVWTSTLLSGNHVQHIRIQRVIDRRLLIILGRAIYSCSTCLFHHCDLAGLEMNDPPTTTELLLCKSRTEMRPRRARSSHRISLTV